MISNDKPNNVTVIVVKCYMYEQLRFMCILAHPDDESLGLGGVLAKYAAEDVETYLITATRGERGWSGPPEENPGLETLGKIREAELRKAGAVLGVRQLTLLDYLDGELDRAAPEEAIGKIVTQLRRLRPQVVATFDPTGAYGHPDHIAISQFAAAAVVAAADPAYAASQEWPPHRVSKFYYAVSTKASMTAYEANFGELVMEVDGVVRRSTGWPEWAITTQIDTSDCWSRVWRAVSCHRSQLPFYGSLQQLTEEQHKDLWGSQRFFRVFSLVNSGRQMETDLFAGLRPEE